MGAFEEDIAQIQEFMDGDRFSAVTRVYSARQVAEQRGTVPQDYTVARDAAAAFYDLLREKFSRGASITSFGPYSPGQAVQMKRAGIEGIYLGGWATSAKGSTDEDPGPDLASYPLSQVPDEAAGLVRGLLTADKNQRFARARMTEAERAATPEVDFRPFIIADADTGHGGDAHVRNLIRRFVEAGVPGYHIEDQKPGAKKCGHQGGKVLVPSDEQIKRLVAARFQLDIMGVGGIIVARTDAEAANLLDSAGDERDQPFILGVTKTSVPSYKAAFLAIIRHLHSKGVEELNGHLIYAVSDDEYAHADAWLASSGVAAAADEAAAAYLKGEAGTSEDVLDHVGDRFLAAWQADAGLKTLGQAVADQIAFRSDEESAPDISVEEWNAFASRASWWDIRAKARSLGVDVVWDAELAQTPEGYYQIQGGIPYAIAKSLAAAPYADLLWMETKTADLADAKEFADAIHEVFPDQMLAYNLSPSFNWDTTGMSDEEMRNFPIELGKMGFVFNFMTYGGHQIDGLAAEEFTTALREDGMLALARLQRKFRLLESPYRTPQTLVGGPRADAALMSVSGQTSTTKAMGEGSTQSQHLVQTEVPPKTLAGWLDEWAAYNKVDKTLTVRLRPHTAGTDLLELAIVGDGDEKLANIVFNTIQDRRGRQILSVRDQNTFDTSLRRKRLMTLLHLFLIHRYKVDAIHYLTPTEDNHGAAASMKNRGIFSTTQDEVGDIIVADIDTAFVAKLVAPDSPEREALITTSGQN
ncbi:isocitrate lyase ICL2 [Miltoncostaea oceani]|jgi:isocitrate lyase|uniref:isocitrate lyase ICL2 n=1 Tax=Miltoncostaea oceani TaxID=2843216 RepID=UPI001C3D7E13|nr:isocitrate lyase ICL2 [Miltoncostaea oceani]